MKKVGIIRCQITEGACAGGADFKAIATGTCAFEAVGKSELVGIVTCGGCPGTKAGIRAKMLVEQGAEVIALTTCITRDTSKKKACVNAQKIMQDVKDNIPESVIFLDHTH